MKAAAFEYRRPATMHEAATILAGEPRAKVLAGGQTLGPMLNLRLTQPSLLLDITRIPEGKAVSETATTVTYGACITHANFEDGRVPDPTGGFLMRVARGIAYRAVRTRGTIGGSLAHADPAGDWLSALSALDSDIGTQGPAEARRLPLTLFLRGALSTALARGEVVVSITIKKPPSGDRFGYAKLCRKTGEFADAIGVVRRDESGKHVRLVAGAAGNAPIVIEEGAEFIADRRLDQERLADRLVTLGMEDAPYERAVHTTVLQRALDESWRS
jgi:aerobic carbon-monoxide dehydrogenase medium subunit